MNVSRKGHTKTEGSASCKGSYANEHGLVVIRAPGRFPCVRANSEQNGIQHVASVREKYSRTDYRGFQPR